MTTAPRSPSPPRFEGLIAATFTPMTPSGDVALDRIGENLAFVLEQGVSGLFVCGSTGEGASLSTDERCAVLDATLNAVGGRVPVIAHVGSNALAEARELARHAQRAGADCVSAVAPSYYRPLSLDALFAFLGALSEAAPDVPLFYYHIPRFTGVELDALDFLARAERALPTLRGIKFSTPAFDQLLTAQRAFGDRFELLFGCDEMLLSALITGVRAAIGSTYNFFGGAYRALLAAFDRGDLETARAEQERCALAVRVLLRHPAPACLKAAMRILGPDCGPPRLPVRDLDAGAVETLRVELAKLGFTRTP